LHALNAPWSGTLIWEGPTEGFIVSEKKEYLTTEEVSDYLKLPVETLYKHARSGKIPACKIGKHWRFDKSEVDRWVSSQNNQFKVSSALQVLVIDDDEMVCSLIRKWIELAGSFADCVTSGEDALSLLRVQRYDLIFLDLRMPQINGVETLMRIKELSSETEVVICTSYFEGKLMEQALELGPLRVLKKPFDRQSLESILNARSSSRSIR